MIGETGGDLVVQLGDHGAGDRAADVIALKQDFTAAAGTHKLVAEMVKARGRVGSAKHREACDGEDD